MVTLVKPSPIATLLIACVIVTLPNAGCGPAETEQERRARTIEARLTADMHRRDIPEEYRPPKPARGDSPYFLYTLFLNVPGAYFERSPPSGGRDYQYLELAAMLPDLRPRWPEKMLPPGVFSAGDQSKERAREYSSHIEDVINITINASANQTSRKSAEGHTRRMAPVLVDRDFHGLEFYRGVHCADGAPRPTTVPAMNARNCWFSSPDAGTAGNPIPPAGYYLAPSLHDDRGIYFSCIFRCTAHTRYKKLSLKYSFKRAHLPDWKEIDQKVTALLDSFYQGFKPASPPPPR